MSQSHACAVSRAVTDLLDSPDFQLSKSSPFPLLEWTSILKAVNDPVHGSVSKTLREDRTTKGSELLSFSFFLILSDTLGQKPHGFLQIIRQSMLSANVLKKLLSRIDARLVDGVTDHPDSGFLYLAGYLWEKEAWTMDELVAWIKTIFKPLLEVAIKRYDSYESRKSKSDKLAGREEKKRKCLTKFLENLKAINPAPTAAHRIIYFEGPQDEPATIFDETPAPGKLPPIFEWWRLLHVDGGQQWDAIDPNLLNAAGSWPPRSQLEDESGVPPVTEPAAAASVTLVVGTTTSVTVSEVDYENVFESFLRDDDDLYLPNSDCSEDGAPEDDEALKDDVTSGPSHLPTTPKKSSKTSELRSPLAPLNH
ncbi:hypothetical protein MVEN_00971500 [Mycena venus]|uniref:Uncharacterized protein n=1 Tax=Mycena venus TaxID=2733690 RepID=A0A8H6YDM4_9AGAR|nr:hypothetical protein MVEN_00971500 [Mycena venus]